MNEVGQVLVDGIGTGSAFALMALAYVLVFRACGVVNLALGETGMLGAFVVASVVVVTGNLLLGLLAGMATAAVVSWAVQATVLRRSIESDHLVAVLLTIGLALLLHTTVALVFGVEERRIESSVARHIWFWGDVAVWRLHVVVGLAALGAFCATAAVLRWTQLGRALRALADDQPVARLVGISAPGIWGASWAIGGAIAALAATFAALSGFLSLGIATLGIAALPALVVGGFDSVRGALVGGLLVGVAQQAAATYVGGQTVELMGFGLLLAVLVLRPAGLFGHREVSRV